MYTHILLPTDGSKLSAKAVKESIRLAKSIGARLTAIHVVQEYQTMLDEGFVMPAGAALKTRFDEETRKRSQKILDAVKAEASASNVSCECITVTSDAPYEAIVKHAKKARCDLIAMASHGRKGLSSLLLGSETAKVLTHSTIPVLVIR